MLRVTILSPSLPLASRFHGTRQATAAAVVQAMKELRAQSPALLQNKICSSRHPNFHLLYKQILQPFFIWQTLHTRRGS